MPPSVPDTTTDDLSHVLVTIGAVVGAAVVAYLVATLVSALIRRLGRRSGLWRDVSVRLRRPDRAVLLVVAVWLAVRATTDRSESWREPVEHLMLVGLIVAIAWWVGALAFVLEDRVLTHYTLDTADNRHARQVRTQITVLRRLTVSVIVVCALAGTLLTFSQARAAGASLLASAGLISIIAGLAAQTSLGNVFAGVQIVFADAIRVDDVVVLEAQWGRIEEITLTYVVVHLWDDRRLILPSTYFTTTPYENWTRRAAELLGTVEMDLDFRVPVGAMRIELDRLLARTELWDHRAGVLQVTDAVGGYAHVRALVSAKDAPTLFDLRCFVREGLVAWLQREAPESMPRVRVARFDEPATALDAAQPNDSVPHEPLPPQRAARADAADLANPPVRLSSTRLGARRVSSPGAGASAGDAPTEVLDREEADASRSALFSGSESARERARQFEGPGDDVIAERERTAEHAMGPDAAHDITEDAAQDDLECAADPARCG